MHGEKRRKISVNEQQQHRQQQRQQQQQQQQQDAEDLAAKVRKSSSVSDIRINHPVIIASCHDHAVKSTCISPSGMLSTCDLGGHVKLWKLKGRKGAMINANNAYWPKSYPEYMTWHPDGQRLFGAFRCKYENCGQVGFTSTATPEEDFTFLRSTPHDPHENGWLRCIRFMPWTASDAPCFVSTGDDHKVVLWSEKEREWSGTGLRVIHSSAVYGVTGTSNKNWIISAGMDKRLVLYDVIKDAAVHSTKHNNPLLDVVMNPKDPNLMFVTASLPALKQIRLHDLRCYDPEKPGHAFGWPLAKSKATRQIHQCWSPNGLYLSSGTLEKMFLVYDIRYNSHQPAVTVRGHNSSVLKAEWHPQHTHLIISTTREGHIWLQNFR